MVEHTVTDQQDSGIKMDSSPDSSTAGEQLLANINGCLQNGGSRASPHHHGSGGGGGGGKNEKDGSHRSTPAANVNNDNNTFDAVLESHKTFQKIAAQLGGFNFPHAFRMNPSLFAAAFQQQSMFNFNNNNLQAASPSSSRQTPDQDEDEENMDDMENLRNDGEPEDLSLGKVKKSLSEAGDDSGSGSANTSWSFEEQFKQLYDIKPQDEVRKAWLDDWFNFMQKINKPVTRIPIMAKQVLDLYELYHLVVKHGGLVEIINKKLWREITKGLNLPPSITSAAFTLRTQYQRYLYDYECDKMNLSSHSELATAIESNKREGRRNPTIGSMGGGNGGNGLMNGSMHGGGNGGGLNPWGMPSIFGKFGSPFGLRPEDETALASLSNAQHALAAGMDPQRQLEFFQRAAAEAATRHPAAAMAAAAAAAAAAASSNNRSGRTSTCSVESTPIPNKRPQPSFPTESKTNNKIPKLDNKPRQPSTKSSTTNSTNNNSTNMKLTTKDNSMYVSMEVNGTMYQGVLFAVPSTASGTSQNNNENAGENNLNNFISNLTAENNENNGGELISLSRSQSPTSNQAFNGSSLTDGLDIGGTLAALFGGDMSAFNQSTNSASLE